MKKIVVLTLAILMTACTSSPDSVTKAKRANSYTSKGLGITFQFVEKYSKDCKNMVEENYNSITSPAVNDKGCFGGTIFVFKKGENQSIEKAILDLVKTESKDPVNCKIVKGNTSESGNTQYVLALSDDYKIEYTPEELKQITDADNQAALDKGPFNGEWQKEEIQAKRLIEVCSDWANPFHAGTSKTIPSYFWYNESKSETVFIHTAGSADPVFYEFD